ncbi:FAD-dependent oxidoreductase [Cellulomonas hominis]|uniref:FAD-dependent oxidoreductase n=1 Tax=Cellulomonas hominis TaxID=156981 RepID=UPI001B9B7B1C|nr:FAD-dependent oxidoreductase [Cellulomonas hominis]VTR75909.1 Benzoate 1,2-dioxygenase electron transfer component [Cellulomonas hominis]
MAWLDERLGRVTMYRLPTLGLSALAVVALVLSATGALFVEPGALLVSAAVAVAASVASAWLLALAFRTRAHTESAVITGLILLFLFWPTLEARYLGTLALAAFVANLAKYVLAWRGRHVLNPAAAGAFVVGLTGWDATTWWVADRWLLVPVLLLTALIVVRTRRYALVGTFVVVALVLVSVRLVVEGAGPGDALRTALVSYPILFLGGVMLTEPLTLPPRRWQQLVEAVVVAALLAVSYHVGPLYSTPEAALIVGNVLAFAWGQRGAVRLTLTRQTRLTPRTVELAFRADRPVRFLPGQYLELTVPHPRPDARGTRRVFSVSSAPAADELTVALTVPERASTFKRALAALPVGTRLRATGLGGDFVLPRDPEQPLLLVAGGIGVTPFASHLAAMAAAGERRDVVLVYAVTDHADLAYADTISATGARVLVLSPTSEQDGLPSGWVHLGERRLAAETLTEAVPDLTQRAAYVSGPPAMVDHTRALLRRAGVRRVRTDAFSGY